MKMPIFKEVVAPIIFCIFVVSPGIVVALFRERIKLKKLIAQRDLEIDKVFETMSVAAYAEQLPTESSSKKGEAK